MRGGTTIRAVGLPEDEISIHPPHAGRDARLSVCLPQAWIFQSTRPVRGGTGDVDAKLVSQHDFNPPAPCGAGHQNGRRITSIKRFQSTRPVRGGTTCPMQEALASVDFNPPAPCGAGLGTQNRRPWLGPYFNPPAPCGAGPDDGLVIGESGKDFNPPAPCGAGRIARILL